MSDAVPATSRRKRVAILQSSYIPWKGYFDLIRHVDEFVLYDDVQFTKRDWRNRNRIKTPRGPIWLTIPVQVSGRYLQAIKDTQVSDPTWNRTHWRSIQENYRRALFFDEFRDVLEELFLGCSDSSLSAINYRFISGLCRLLGITTKLSWSMDYQLEAGRNERLIGLCRQAHATEYISGPAALGYIDPVMFEAAGIALTFFDYSGYQEYPQFYPPFDHHVSVIDLLLHTGAEAPAYLLPIQQDR